MGPQHGHMQGCQLRPGCALKIQRFTLAYHVFLAIVDLLKAILDRCCTRIPFSFKYRGTRVYVACAAQSWPKFHY